MTISRYDMIRPHGLMFHHFHNAIHPTVQGSISAEQFADMIQYVGRERILSAKEWTERALNGHLKNGDLCITLDDSLRCQYDVALPILKHFGIEAFWFIYTSVMEGQLEKLEIYRYFRTVHFKDINDFYREFNQTILESPYKEEVLSTLSDFKPESYAPAFQFYTNEDRQFRFLRNDVLGVERYVEIMDSMIEKSKVDVERISQKLWMDATCLRELKRLGHDIGLHSHTHPTVIERLNRKGQEREYKTNYTSLTKLLGSEPKSMSHPCNSYNVTTISVLKKLNVKLGFRANMELYPNLSHLEYPREDHANLLRKMA